MRRRGFTLIELLVVLAIVALLIAILLPALVRARSQGSSARCLAAMREVGVSLSTHLQGNGDRFPLSRAQAGPDTPTWETVLATGGRRSLRCPVDRSPGFESNDPAALRTTSYGVNIYLGPPVRYEASPPKRLLPPMGYEMATRIKDVGATVYLGEIAEATAEGDPIISDHLHAEMWGTNPFTGIGGVDPHWDVATMRHARRANYVFVDAHAASATFDTTWRLSDDGLIKETDRWDPGFPHSPEGWFRPSGRGDGEAPSRRSNRGI